MRSRPVEEVAGLTEVQLLADATGADAGAYHWGTLYDMLGYSASGSLIDYYNTRAGSTARATRPSSPLASTSTVRPGRRSPRCGSTRSAPSTHADEAVPRRPALRLPGRQPHRVRLRPGGRHRHRRARRRRPRRRRRSPSARSPTPPPGCGSSSDLSPLASPPLTPIRVPDVLANPSLLDRYESLVLADDPMPEPGDKAAWVLAPQGLGRAGRQPRRHRRSGACVGRSRPREPGDVASSNAYVGFVDFGDRSVPLNAGLRGVASQTYDSVPIGFASRRPPTTAPNWTVASAAWEAAGGTTAGTNGTGRTAYGERRSARARSASSARCSPSRRSATSTPTACRTTPSPTPATRSCRTCSSLRPQPPWSLRRRARCPAARPRARDRRRAGDPATPHGLIAVALARRTVRPCGSPASTTSSTCAGTSNAPSPGGRLRSAARASASTSGGRARRRSRRSA